MHGPPLSTVTQGRCGTNKWHSTMVDGNNISRAMDFLKYSRSRALALENAGIKFWASSLPNAVHLVHSRSRALLDRRGKGKRARDDSPSEGLALGPKPKRFSRVARRASPRQGTKTRLPFPKYTTGTIMTIMIKFDGVNLVAFSSIYL
jgi:hypothetical protein